MGARQLLRSMCGRMTNVKMTISLPGWRAHGLDALAR